MFPLEYFLFLQIILFLFITPGTPRIIIISYSINYGIKKCVWTALGDISANIIQATLVIFFIGSFISDYPLFLNIFKWAGVAYIIYLAYDIYKSRVKEINSSTTSKKSFLSFYKDGFLVAGTSPKAWMFFPFVFPQFIDFNSNYISQFLILITTYVVLDFFFFNWLCNTCKKINCVAEDKSKKNKHNFSVCFNCNCTIYFNYPTILIHSVYCFFNQLIV